MTNITKDQAVELGHKCGLNDKWEADNYHALCQAAIDWAAKQGEPIGFVRTVDGKPEADADNIIFCPGSGNGADTYGSEVWIPVFDHPAPVNQAWTLPDSEIDKVIEQQWGENVANHAAHRAFARAILKKAGARE